MKANGTCFQHGEEIVFTINTQGAERWVCLNNQFRVGEDAATDNSAVWKTTAKKWLNPDYQFAVQKEGIWSDFSTVTIAVDGPEGPDEDDSAPDLPDMDDDFFF